MPERVMRTNQFQPAPPARRATTCALNFNPRPPHGGRHSRWRVRLGSRLFQPAPPARRATPPYLMNGRDQPFGGISTRAPRTEGDLSLRTFRARTGRRLLQIRHATISTRAPRTEGDVRR